MADEFQQEEGGESVGELKHDSKVRVLASPQSWQMSSSRKRAESVGELKHDSKVRVLASPQSWQISSSRKRAERV